MQEDQDSSFYRQLAQSPEDVRPLHQMCLEGRLYDVERWIAEGKAIQMVPDALPKGRRPAHIQDQVDRGASPWVGESPEDPAHVPEVAIPRQKHDAPSSGES